MTKSKENKERYQKYHNSTDNPIPYRDWLKHHEGSNGTDRNPPSGTAGLSRRERVLLDPLGASERSDTKND